MKKFNIEVISKKPKKIWGLSSHEGQITIDDFKETFVMPLNSWNLEDYKKQWQEGIARLKTHKRSCLVTSIQNMASGHPSIIMWTLYKEDDIVFVQNNLLISETTKGRSVKLTDFNLTTCYKFTKPRKTLTQEGRKISEWSIPLSEI
jgi:hypothetical protein